MKIVSGAMYPYQLYVHRSMYMLYFPNEVATNAFDRIYSIHKIEPNSVEILEVSKYSTKRYSVNVDSKYGSIVGAYLASGNNKLYLIVITGKYSEFNKIVKYSNGVIIIEDIAVDCFTDLNGWTLYLHIYEYRDGEFKHVATSNTDPTVFKSTSFFLFPKLPVVYSDGTIYILYTYAKPMEKKAKFGLMMIIPDVAQAVDLSNVLEEINREIDSKCILDYNVLFDLSIGIVYFEEKSTFVAVAQNDYTFYDDYNTIVLSVNIENGQSTAYAYNAFDILEGIQKGSDHILVFNCGDTIKIKLDGSMQFASATGYLIDLKGMLEAYEPTIKRIPISQYRSECIFEEKCKGTELSKTIYLGSAPSVKEYSTPLKPVSSVLYPSKFVSSQASKRGNTPCVMYIEELHELLMYYNSGEILYIAVAPEGVDEFKIYSAYIDGMGNGKIWFSNYTFLGDVPVLIDTDGRLYIVYEDLTVLPAGIKQNETEATVAYFSFDPVAEISDMYYTPRGLYTAVTTSNDHLVLLKPDGSAETLLSADYIEGIANSDFSKIAVAYSDYTEGKVKLAVIDSSGSKYTYTLPLNTYNQYICDAFCGSTILCTDYDNQELIFFDTSTNTVKLRLKFSDLVYANYNWWMTPDIFAYCIGSKFLLVMDFWWNDTAHTFIIEPGKVIQRIYGCMNKVLYSATEDNDLTRGIYTDGKLKLKMDLDGIESLIDNILGYNVYGNLGEFESSLVNESTYLNMYINGNEIEKAVLCPVFQHPVTVPEIADAPYEITCSSGEGRRSQKGKEFTFGPGAEAVAVNKRHERLKRRIERQRLSIRKSKQEYENPLKYIHSSSAKVKAKLEKLKVGFEDIVKAVKSKNYEIVTGITDCYQNKVFLVVASKDKGKYTVEVYTAESFDSKEVEKYTIDLSKYADKLPEPRYIYYTYYNGEVLDIVVFDEKVSYNFYGNVSRIAFIRLKLAKQQKGGNIAVYGIECSC